MRANGFAKLGWAALSMLVALVAMTAVAQAPVGAMIGGQAGGALFSNVGAVDIRLAGAPIVASGVLVSPTVLVTAGHVTEYFDRAGQTRARVSFDADVDSGATWYWGTVHTDPRYVHPETQYDPNDLGVIVFDAPIPGVSPAELPTEGLLDAPRLAADQTLRFQDVGYGASVHVGSAKDQGVGSFAGGGTRRYVQSQFVNAYSGWVEARPVDGHECYGDSGGPMMLGAVVVAIHKYSSNGNFCTGPVLKMRLDTAPHRAFLGQYVALP